MNIDDHGVIDAWSWAGPQCNNAANVQVFTETKWKFACLVQLILEFCHIFLHDTGLNIVKQ